MALVLCEWLDFVFTLEVLAHAFHFMGWDVVLVHSAPFVHVELHELNSFGLRFRIFRWCFFVCVVMLWCHVNTECRKCKTSHRCKSLCLVSSEGIVGNMHVACSTNNYFMQCTELDTNSKKKEHKVKETHSKNTRIILVRKTTEKYHMQHRKIKRCVAARQTESLTTLDNRQDEQWKPVVGMTANVSVPMIIYSIKTNGNM